MPKDGIPVLQPNNQMYLSLTGIFSVEKYFNVLILWTEVEEEGG
jgi:hypothetical protein